MMNPRNYVCVLALVLAPTMPALGQQPSPAGRIKVATGTVFIVRGSDMIPAKAGQLLFEADGLRTGTDGRLGLTLMDDTRVSLSPNSEVRLDRFAYAPAEGRLALVLRVLHGIAVYVSGRIAKLSPDSIHLQTPTAIVGIRGTTVGIRVGV